MKKKMNAEKENYDRSSDSNTTSFVVSPDRLSLYHLQKKHERLQQQQFEQKNQITNPLLTNPKLFKTENPELVSVTTPENDHSRSSSSNSMSYADCGSITSSTLTQSSSSSNFSNSVSWNAIMQSKHLPSVLKRPSISSFLKLHHYQFFLHYVDLYWI